MTLEVLRKEIDEINASIIALFSRRLTLAIKIGKVKKEHGLPICDHKREALQLETVRTLAEEQGLNPNVIEEIFTLFIDYTKVMESHR